MAIRELNKDEAFIQQLLKGCLDYVSVLGWRQTPPRQPGISHSSAGKCPKALLAKQAGMKDFPNPGGSRRMSLGTELHSVMDQAIEMFLGEHCGSNLLRVNNFRVHSFRAGKHVVTGTHDGIFLDFLQKVIWMVDFKSSDTRSFEKKTAPKRKLPNGMRIGGASASHKMQLAGYRASEEVQALAERLGMKVKALIVYIDKSTLNLFPEKIAKGDEDAAREYWELIYQQLGFYEETQILPQGSPPRDESGAPLMFHCQYCNLFPPVEDKIWSTLKEEADAIREVGERNFQACFGCLTIEDMNDAVLEMSTAEELTCLMEACQTDVE